MKSIFCLIFVYLFVFSCKKDKKVESKIVGCPEMYDTRSKPYVNPYMGRLINKSAIPCLPTYPEQYCYYGPCVNPNNNYEIAYCRLDNKTEVIDHGLVRRTKQKDLYTYNFCTGKTTFLASNIDGKPDWSVKNWIIFKGRDSNFWKVKPNGDSLTQLNPLASYNVNWSKDGTKYVWGNGQVSNEKGILLHNSSYSAEYIWKNNRELISGIETSNPRNFEIFTIDIKTKTKTKIKTISLASVPTKAHGEIHTLYKDNLYFSITNPDNGGETKKHYSMNINTLDITFRYELPRSFEQNITSGLNNKLLLQQVLRDTLPTSDPHFINYKSHIAIMNVDGTNERQVLIPE